MTFWLTLIGGLVATAGTGVALGAALGLTGMVILHVFSNGATSLAVDAIWSVFNSFTLSAVPMFILLGEVLLRSGHQRKGLCRLLAAVPAHSRRAFAHQYRGLHPVRRGQRLQPVDRRRGRLCRLSGDVETRL